MFIYSVTKVFIFTLIVFINIKCSLGYDGYKEKELFIVLFKVGVVFIDISFDGWFLGFLKIIFKIFF